MMGADMHDVDLFQRALGLEESWQVVDVQLTPPSGGWICGSTSRRARGSVALSVAGRGCEVHDAEQKTWRHLDFFQHHAYLTARVPGVRCPEDGVRQVEVPWARERSGFTLLFEALVMAMVKEMPVAAVAGLIGESDMRIWRVVHHYVDQAVEAQDLSRVQRAGIDETSSRRGQDYCSPISISAARCMSARAAIRARCRHSPAGAHAFRSRA
jgi:transposase